MSGKDVDPVERLLHEYILPEFLKKALWLSKGGSQPDYSEDGFANANGAPNYTRILVKLGYLTLRPGFRGRKASIYDYEPELTPDEKLVQHGTDIQSIGEHGGVKSEVLILFSQTSPTKMVGQLCITLAIQASARGHIWRPRTSLTGAISAMI